MEKLRLFPAVLFSAYFLKVLALGSAWTDAPVLLIAALLFAFMETKVEKKQFNELKAQLNDQKEINEQHAKKIEELKTYVSSLKLSQTRSINGR